MTYVEVVDRLKRAYCRVVGHTGEWSYPDARCVRARACRRCGWVQNEQMHTWSPFEYLAGDRCDQERRCARCSASESRTVHAWGPWRYVGRDHVLLKLHQVRTCGRCNVQEEQEFERAF